MEAHRSQRVSEALREELEEIVSFELEDPRLHQVSIRSAHVSPDMRHATVQVTVPGGPQAENQAIHALDHAKTFLRRQLAARLDLRRTPDLHFAIAANVTSEERIDQLLRRARRTRGRTDEPS